MDTSIKAVKFIKDKIENFKLLIVGAKRSERVEIENLISKLNIENYVEIINWVPFEKVNQYIKHSKVCLVPHNDFEHTQTTIPHKLFQYMMMGKPVIVSDCKPLKRVVNETESGLVLRQIALSNYQNQ